MSSSPQKQHWHRPSDVMKLHALKQKKKALQARISGVHNEEEKISSPFLDDILCTTKRKNPFAKDTSCIQPSKRSKGFETQTDTEIHGSSLFTLLHCQEQDLAVEKDTLNISEMHKSLNKREDDNEVLLVQGEGEPHAPLDWSLKTKMRLFSTTSFSWNTNKLKMSEEASGTTGFVRCLNKPLDTSPNAQFNECCHYWQQPSLPWISLFPRTIGRAFKDQTNITSHSEIKTSLQTAFGESFRSLFQLIRTKQCPYFYLCANTFTCLFRAAGICGLSNINVLVTPTTRGFRQMLKKAEVEFSMPLKVTTSGSNASNSSHHVIDDNKEEGPDEQWLESMGVDAENIKQINYIQANMVAKTECQVDYSDQSLVLVKGVEVHALYNVLMNCKSATTTTGPFANIPPTLLAPVAFNGATLQTLKVRENKVNVDNVDLYAMEIHGPILPSMISKVFALNSREHSMSASFVRIPSTLALNYVKESSKMKNSNSTGNVIFNKENLSDCGLNGEILEVFCNPDIRIKNVECLKYNSKSQTYTWN